MKRLKEQSRWQAIFLLQVVCYILFTFVALLMIAAPIIFVLYKLGLHPSPTLNLIFDSGQQTFVNTINMVVMMSVQMGLAITAFVGFVLLKPMRRLSKAMSAVAGGDYTIQMPIMGIHEVKEISRNFNTMVNELGSTQTINRDMINHISHEFKTPITSISGFAKLLQNPALPEDKKREFIEIIVTESEKLAQLATNVLNLSKYEALSIVTDKNPCQLDEQIRRILLLLEPKWSAKNLDVELDLAEITFFGNAGLLEVIWNNLLDNAVKYSPQGGALQLSLKRQGNQVVFSVQDEGPGMDEETQKHIFDRFYQGGAAHAPQGHGLGLALVKRIVELYCGEITVRSAPEQGSTFIVKLPMDA